MEKIIFFFCYDVDDFLAKYQIGLSMVLVLIGSTMAYNLC